MNASVLNQAPSAGVNDVAGAKHLAVTPGAIETAAERPQVLVVEDDAALLEAIVSTLELAGWTCLRATDGGMAELLLSKQHVDVVVSDLQMQPIDGMALLARVRAHFPELPFFLMTAYGTVERAVAAIKDGAVDFLEKPFEPEVLVTKLDPYFASATPKTEGLVAEDPNTIRVMQLAERVAQTEAPVLLTGESGVGKEVFFRYIHDHSARAAQSPVAINCAAIPENMLEAILFGYEKGAFTGAYKATPGKFELSNGSSLLLDEISEMSLPLQAKLLRVLQERQVERLGGNRLNDLDVRIVATSNRDMKAEVAAGRFREDLYFRLNVFPLSIPPLRERPGDIAPIAHAFLARFNRTDGTRVPGFRADGLAALAGYSWPGNVRELQNVVRRAAILAGDTEIGLPHILLEGDDMVTGAAGVAPIPATTATSTTTAAPNMPTTDFAAPRDSAGGLDSAVRNEEFRLILAALEAGAGSRKFAAEKLGISPRTLRYKIAQMRDAGIEVPK